jgi:hypothetical protein
MSDRRIRGEAEEGQRAAEGPPRRPPHVPAAPPRLFPDRIADRYRDHPDHHHDRAAPVEPRAHVSQETAAIGAIRTIHTMQVQYYSQYGRYAASLTELGPPTSGAPGPAAADLIDGTLAGGTKSGTSSP